MHLFTFTALYTHKTVLRTDPAQPQTILLKAQKPPTYVCTL